RMSSGEDSRCQRSHAVSRSSAAAWSRSRARSSSTSTARVAASGSTTSTFTCQCPTHQGPKATGQPFTPDLGRWTCDEWIIRAAGIPCKRRRGTEALVENSNLVVLHAELYGGGSFWEKDIYVGTPHAVAGVGGMKDRIEAIDEKHRAERDDRRVYGDHPLADRQPGSGDPSVRASDGLL